MEGQASGYATDPRTIEGQFLEFKYPAPGHSPIKMYYKYGGSHFGTMSETNRYVKAYRSNNLECVVNQSVWFEGEAKFGIERVARYGVGINPGHQFHIVHRGVGLGVVVRH